MKLAIVTAYPPSKVTLNEYAYHLVKHFRQKERITEIVLLTDKTEGKKDITFIEEGCKITVKECWKFNSYLNIINVTKAINNTQPDAVLFNLQFMKFGDKKIAAALGLLLPLVCKLKHIPNIVLLHNILEEVDLDAAGFTSNKLLQKAYGFIGATLTRLLLQSDTVVVTMQKYVDILEKKYNAKNVFLIPHGTFEVSKETPDFSIRNRPLQIMTFVKELQYKIEKKVFEVAKQYYHIEDYIASIKSFDNLISDYLGTSFREEAIFYKLKASYELGIKSVLYKKEERLDAAVKVYDKLKRNYPESEYTEESDKMLERINKELATIKNTVANIEN